MSARAHATVQLPARREVIAVLRVMYENVLGHQMREGRLRLSSFPASVRHPSLLGLLVIGVFLVSLVFSDLWRAGDLALVRATSGGRPAAFVPVALLPVTLVALAITWSVILWGAARASLPMAAAVGFAFLALNAPLSRPPVLAIEGVPAMQVGPTVAQAAYYATPLLSLSLHLARTRLPVAVTWALAAALVITVAALHFVQLAIHGETLRRGFESPIPADLDGTFMGMRGLFAPLVFVSGIGVIEFAYGISKAAVVPFTGLSEKVAVGVLAAGLALKLVLIVGTDLDGWAGYVRERPEATLHAIATVAAFAAIALLVRRLRQDREAVDRALEPVTYTGAVALALPGILLMLVLLLALALVAQFRSPIGADIVRNVQVGAFIQNGNVVVWVLVLAAGAWLLHRARAASLEIGLGLVLVAAWVLHIVLWQAAETYPGLRMELVDLVFSAALLGYVVLRWRRLDTRGALGVGAMALFAWLFTTEGDFIGVTGALLGLDQVIVVAFGLVFALLAGSSFVTGNSRFFPRESRPLLWLGYLALSLVILNWSRATHGGDSGAEAGSRAFLMLGVPLAAWLFMRNPPVLEAAARGPA